NDLLLLHFCCSLKLEIVLAYYFAPDKLNEKSYKSWLEFFFSSRRRHTRSVSAFLLNRSSDLINIKLMDELAQCYNVLPQLDINNTIDHRPEGDRSEERRVGKECRCGKKADY